MMVVLKSCIASCGCFLKVKCLAVPFIHLPKMVSGMRHSQRARTGLPMTRMAPLVGLGCVPRISATPAPFVWSTLLDARAIAMPWTRMAWHWASVFNI